MTEAEKILDESFYLEEIEDLALEGCVDMYTYQGEYYYVTSYKMADGSYVEIYEDEAVKNVEIYGPGAD